MKIAVDICNCLADIDAELNKCLGPKPDSSVYHHPKLTKNFFENHPEVFEKALPIPGAAEGVWWLYKNYEIIYLTARPKTSIRITEEWLSRWGFPQAQMVFSPKKAVAVKHLGIDCAIDDEPTQILSLGQVVTVLIHNRPYNSHLPGMRFTWTEPQWKYFFYTIAFKRKKNVLRKTGHFD